jgi:hypothetical protein
VPAQELVLTYILMATIPTLPADQEPDEDDLLTATDDDGRYDEQDADTWVPNPALFPWNEDMPTDLQDCAVKLAKEMCDEFRYPRRLEVMQSWRARSFWREMQHLTWNWEQNAWDVLGPAGAGEDGRGGGDHDSAVMYTTNMYQGFGDSFIAIVTQATIGLRFEPEDIDEPADVEAAEAAEPMRRLIQHENDPIMLATKMAYLAWTDGRLHGWTRWEMNKRTHKPMETQSIYGVLEVKVPVIYECIEEYPYLQFSTEYHLSTVRDKVKKRAFKDKDYWKKIKGGSSGNGQDVYERTTRISIKQGISLQSAGGDAYGSLVTTQCTWIRPTEFMRDCVSDEYRDQLYAAFPNGMYLEVDNGVYTGSREANMDDEWAVENIMEGDGSYRNAKGTCLISVQERDNDIINIAQDVYEKTQPASHWDQKIFNYEAMKRQKSGPGYRYPVDLSAGTLQPGEAIANHVYYEPAAVVSADMLAYEKTLRTELPQFLTGISSILFGSDGGGSGDKSSGKALSIQQAAAMGRVGLPFRVMKRFYARMMEQAIRCAARNRKDDISMGLPDENGKMELVSVRIEDLTGNIRCYPDVDENIPESWMQKRAILLQLMQDQDPAIKAILAAPENMRTVKRLIGLDELTIPQEASWQKQMGEIAQMLVQAPIPPQPQPPKEVPNPMMPHVIETVQPPPVPARSSIPVDPIMDDHVAEGLTVKIWCNSPKGLKMKVKDSIGFQNVRLHGIQHLQIAAQQAAQAAAAAAPPPKAPPPGNKPPKGGKLAGGPPKPAASPAAP